MSRKPMTEDLERWAAGTAERWRLATLEAMERGDYNALPILMVETAELHGMVVTLATLRRMGAA